jgi:hypothetical protein
MLGKERVQFLAPIFSSIYLIKLVDKIFFPSVPCGGHAFSGPCRPTPPILIYNLAIIHDGMTRRHPRLSRFLDYFKVLFGKMK